MVERRFTAAKGKTVRGVHHMASSSPRIQKFGVAFGAAMLGVCTFSLATAGKPPAPPTVPPASGTIFIFDYSSPAGIKAMNPDGGNKVLLPPAAITPLTNSNSPKCVPSRLGYGSDPARNRIWLAFADIENFTYPETGGIHARRELFAYKLVDVGGTIVTKTCQITNLYPEYRIDPSYNGNPAWSNGGDAFVAFPMRNGSNMSAPSMLVRAWVTGAQIDAAIAAGTNLNLDADAFTTGQFEVVATLSATNSEFEINTWSPDGNQVAYATNDWSSGSSTRYMVKTLGAGSTLEIASSTSSRGIEWSPDGSRIVFNSDRSISTISPDGSNLSTPFVGSSAGNLYHAIRWSPDSTQIVFAHVTYSRNKWNYQVKRSLATGGSTVVLTNDLPSEANKYPIAWVP
jgi:hypothetical protein